ncbi:MAG: hypothetical protein PWQ67_2577 [Clostridia bacterium]|nr:hypothetical protein [Clostridia bacterium]
MKAFMGKILLKELYNIFVISSIRPRRPVTCVKQDRLRGFLIFLN